MRFGYQWKVDFANPLNLIPQHNQYVLVMIEHFSKWLEFVPLPYHSNERITYAFLDMVFNRFGAQAEILFDKGIELHGKFHELCEKALINHHTSRNHPEADGLIE
jgi:hypothetical protein